MEFGLRDRPKGGSFFGVPPTFGNFKGEGFLRIFSFFNLVVVVVVVYCGEVLSSELFFSLSKVLD